MSKLVEKVLLVFFVLGLLLNTNTQQNNLKLMAEVPIQFGVGFEGKLNKHFSAVISAGLLTSPNSTLIIDVLEKLGTDEQITLMIEDAFEFGVVGEAGISYNFGRNYIGPFFQIIALHGGEAPTAIVEDYFNTSMSNYPTRRNSPVASEKYLHLKSTLYQGGILFGHRFPLKNTRIEIDAEVGLSANLGSKSELTSDVRNLSSLSTIVDRELAGYYSEYAFVPSLAIGLAYKLNKYP